MQLEARRIGFRYGKGPWIMRNISMVIQAGEVIALTGPSGCGKTTLGRIIAGYEQPLEGHILLNQVPPPTQGYHPVQLIHQHPEKSVNPRWRMHEILDEGWQPDPEVLDMLGIKQEWMYRWPHELSGGELQRFCVARALNPQTKFLIADEMTTMLDAITQAQIWQAILTIAQKRKMGVLVISHEQALIQRLCTRSIQLA